MRGMTRRTKSEPARANGLREPLRGPTLRPMKPPPLTVGQTVYYTRYALTTGIKACAVVADKGDRYVSLKGVGFLGRLGVDTFSTTAEAQAHVKTMATRRLK